MKKHLTLILAALFLCSAGRIDAQVAAGEEHSLFRCSSGEVMACGIRVGDGTTIERTPPIYVPGLSGIVAVSADGIHSLFLKSDGTVWSCGDNRHGELGDGTHVDRYSPVQVSGLSGIIAVAAGWGHSLFLKNDGTVWACGWNIYGQLGNGTTSSTDTPVQVVGLAGIIAIDAGYKHSIFLKNDRTVWTCGHNDYGQLGDGNNHDKTYPIQVSLFDITAVSAGSFHSLFLKSDGTVWACGRNQEGELGVGSASGVRRLPVQVAGLTGVIAIAGGLYHSLFLKNDSTAWACGSNQDGQLGDGTTTQRNAPVQVSGLTGITTIAAGGGHSLFLKNDGIVWSCGDNGYGRLGDGTYVDRHSPVPVQNLCRVSSISTIFGRIITEAGGPIPGVTVMLSGADSNSMTTNISGLYSFNVERNGTYTITPSKNNDSITNNGITMTDALLMRRHSLGMGALPSPYKIIAAAEVSADGDTTITTQDILFTRSLILGNITSFPTNRLWQFVSSDYVFPDSQHPFPFDKTRTYTNITTNQTNQDFIGIKLGDVNGSWDPNVH